IDHMLENGLAVPTKKQLQARGHNIADLYDECGRIGVKRQSPIPNRAHLDSIDQELLLLLSDFARATRYHNLDALSASQISADPLAGWGELIIAILGHDVPQKRKDEILAQTNVVATAIDDVTVTLMHGLDQSPLTTAEALS